MSNTYILMQCTPEAELDAEAAVLLQILAEDALNPDEAVEKLQCGTRAHTLCCIDSDDVCVIANIIAMVAKGVSLKIALEETLKYLD